MRWTEISAVAVARVAAVPAATAVPPPAAARRRWHPDEEHPWRRRISAESADPGIPSWRLGDP